MFLCQWHVDHPPFFFITRLPKGKTCISPQKKTVHSQRSV
ncbi:hypothetical protein CHCC19466_1440 [Bacillus licheniformis]|nr:hypothetical protein CHCC20496_1812 [Bacillus licheniformis]TWK09675.1 hypothetical protein CHCC20442_4462 [Bacillus licheniformis]TWK14732.1 hypothetical protein CHCC20373_4391 [Bacillus licheniformis]TWK29234.1 hypothetical protein CHCC20369_0581 [Bacillus licheniformis]TWK69494.1 hypothetical protein CHCC20341_0347 [Bacillus licheniformis]